MVTSEVKRDIPLPEDKAQQEEAKGEEALMKQVASERTKKAIPLPDDKTLSHLL